MVASKEALEFHPLGGAETQCHPLGGAQTHLFGQMHLVACMVRSTGIFTNAPKSVKISD